MSRLESRCQAEDVFEFFREVQQEKNLTSLLATHNANIALRCDRVLLLGKRVFEVRHQTIMFERYTEKARRVIFFARYEASQYGSPIIETEHLLLGLMREDKSLDQPVFALSFLY